MVKIVDARDLVAINNKLSQQWEISELSYNNIELNSYKRQRIYENQQDVKTENSRQVVNDFKLSGNFP